jgi:hypothetical protein
MTLSHDTQTYLHGKLNMNNDETRSGEMYMVQMNGPKVSKGGNMSFRGAKFLK